LPALSLAPKALLPMLTSQCKCNDKPGGTAGNVDLLDLNSLQLIVTLTALALLTAAFNNRHSISGGHTLIVLSIVAPRVSLAMLTAPLFALTSLVAELARSTSSKSLIALQVTVTITAFMAKLTAASKSRPGISSGHVDCSLTCSEYTTGNDDSAATCTDKPGGTAGNVDLFERISGAAAYCISNSVDGRDGTVACNCRPGIPGGHVDCSLLLVALLVALLAPRVLLAMLTALLLAMTSLVALLAMSSFSKASPALQLIVTLTTLVTLLEPLLAIAGLVFPVAKLTILSLASRVLLAMLTALLLAMTNLVALLGMSSSSSALTARCRLL